MRDVRSCGAARERMRGERGDNAVILLNGHVLVNKTRVPYEPVVADHHGTKSYTSAAGNVQLQKNMKQKQSAGGKHELSKALEPKCFIGIYK